MHLGVAEAVVGDQVVPGDVEVVDGRVQAVGISGADGSGMAVPGFVDLHVHGHGGVDFVEATVEDHRRIARQLTSTGVTAYHPTLMSMPIEDMIEALGHHPGSMESGARVLGFHLEGPFLSPSRPGAHRSDALIEPTPDLIRQLVESGPVSHITLAPELAGGLEAIDLLIEAGVVVSLGHSVATSNLTHEAVDRGAKVFTHLFNAMGPFNHRGPGMIGVALSRDDVYLSVIFDGVHLSAEAAQIAVRCAGRRLVAITDGTAAINAASGRTVLGDAKVEIIDGAPRLPDGTIAGSILTMDGAFRNLVSLGLSVASASQATSTTPARLAGLQGVGPLEPGSVADITILDTEYRVVRTLVDGKEVFSA